jgi:hypothetical protein
MPVCPILKVTEALYRGGIQALPEGDESCSCKIDNITYVFDDAPVINGLAAFDSVRRGGQQAEEHQADDEDIILDDQHAVGSLRALDSLHMLEIRKSISDLVKTGAADVPTREELAEKYTVRKKTGGADGRGHIVLKDSERAMVSRIQELAKR